MSEQTSGQKAYQAYAAACKGKDGLGRDILPWEKMSKPDQEVWGTTAQLLGLPDESPYEVQNIAGLMGEIAYNAYCDHVGWKGFNGDPLPEWGNARQHIRDGWCKAGCAVMHATMNPEAKPEARPEAEAEHPADPGDSDYPTRASRDGALKYELIPDDGSGCQIPTAPFGMTAEDLGRHITGRLLTMEHQGHWRNNRMESVPLERVEYHIRVVDPHGEDEEGQ